LTLQVPIEPFLFDWKISSDILKEENRGVKFADDIFRELGYISSPTFLATGAKYSSEWYAQMQS
jgi:hypothetical protein